MTPTQINFSLCRNGETLPLGCVHVVGARIVKDGKLQHLTLTEWAEHLRVNGGPDSSWGDAILDLAAVGEDHEALVEHVDEEIGIDRGQSAQDVITDAARNVRCLAEVRDVLVEAGALAADDNETALADLVRALLS